MDESTLLRLDPDEKKLDEQESKFPNSTFTSTETMIELSTKSHVDSLHETNTNR